MPDDLRSLLRDGADRVDVPILDVAGVMAGGRARKTRMRVGVVAGIALFAVAVGFGFRVMDLGERATDTRPATPSESPIPLPGELPKHPAMAPLNRGDLEAARALGQEELATAPGPEHWDHGNAIHIGNLILGHVAVREGDLDAAAEYLLEAGRTPGSPSLGSFGPNMSLARDLLLSGKRDAVLEYLDLVDGFWDDRNGLLPVWRAYIREGAMPDFGANLDYGTLNPSPVEQLGNCEGCVLPRERR